MLPVGGEGSVVTVNLMLVTLLFYGRRTLWRCETYLESNTTSRDCQDKDSKAFRAKTPAEQPQQVFTNHYDAIQTRFVTRGVPVIWPFLQEALSLYDVGERTSGRWRGWQSARRVCPKNRREDNIRFHPPTSNRFPMG